MFRTLLVLSGLIITTGCTPESQVSGRALYDDYCAGCHGSGGKGDGPAAEGLGKMPADLTMLSARNDGVFPKVAVMSAIDGYTRRGDRSSVMPELGPVLQEGPLVLVDTGDGAMTPTPANLVALANYLERLQQ